MSSLAELQSQMTAAIFKGHAAEIEDQLVAGRADPARRFKIYRNNTFLSLTAHLNTVFPVTARLGDERFFAYAANEYIRREPPHEPRLAVYGVGFPRFLARFPACRWRATRPSAASSGPAIPFQSPTNSDWRSTRWRRQVISVRSA